MTASPLPPPLPKDPTYVAPPRKDTPGRVTPHVVAEIILHDGQVKEGRVQGFTIRCDEGPHVGGGTDTAPSPLGYFTAGIGFCLGTHIAGTARRQNIAMKVSIKVDAEYYAQGSVLRGDRQAGCEGLAIEVSVETDAPAETVARIVKEAESGCFALGSMRNPSPVVVSAVLRGEPLELPATLERSGAA